MDMTKRERLLALEAALCACEGLVPHAEALRSWLDKQEFAADFGTFLQEQRVAVKKLAECPQVFGG